MTIALLAPCLAAAVRPSLQKAVLDLGQRLGLDIVVVSEHTCCGLTAWQAGQLEAAQAAAARTVRLFADFAAVVTTSPACLRMLTQVMPQILAGTAAEAGASQLAGRSYTWCDYLARNTSPQQRRFRGTGSLSYYRACTSAADSAPLSLLHEVEGVRVIGSAASQCCGYNGNLAWRRPDISRATAEPVVGLLRLDRADRILTADAGCLIHLAAFFGKSGDPPVEHVAEFLAAHFVER